MEEEHFGFCQEKMGQNKERKIMWLTKQQANYQNII